MFGTAWYWRQRFVFLFVDFLSCLYFPRIWAWRNLCPPEQHNLRSRNYLQWCNTVKDILCIVCCERRCSPRRWDTSFPYPFSWHVLLSFSSLFSLLFSFLFLFLVLWSFLTYLSFRFLIFSFLFFFPFPFLSSFLM